jgi:DNA-binding NtrC family response regulator
MEQIRPSVLIVDDETIIADTLVQILSMSGFNAVAAYDAEKALELAVKHPPQMLISDVRLPGMNGIDLASQMRRIFPDCKILLYSGHAGTTDLMSKARARGEHFDLLTKPVHPSDLIKHVGTALNPKPHAS